MARSKHPPKRNYFVRIVGPVLIIGLTLVLALSGRTENEILRPADITSEFIGQRLQLMQDWFLANERLGQTLPYLYYPERKEYSNDDNIVRQLLATQGIFVLARELSSPELEQLAFRQLAATLLEYYREESETGFGFFEGNGTVKLGGAALGIITILESPQPEIYGVKLSKLADFIRAMQQLDGSFQTFYRPPDFERNERFYSGEALLAAARLARYTGDSSWLDYVEHGLTYYEPLLKTRFMPQFAPWHTMAYSEMFEQTGEQKYADFVFYLNDRLIDEMLQTDVADPAQLGRFIILNTTPNGVRRIVRVPLFTPRASPTPTISPCVLVTGNGLNVIVTLSGSAPAPSCNSSTRKETRRISNILNVSRVPSGAQPTGKKSALTKQDTRPTRCQGLVEY